MVGIFWQAVQPSTGDVLYDEFEDGPSYTELESHFEHISPEELLLPGSLTLQTENFIRDYVTRVQRFVNRSLSSSPPPPPTPLNMSNIPSTKNRRGED